MPKVDLSFQGWIRGVEITTVIEVASGNEVDVTQVSAGTLVGKLQEGEWSVALGDLLYSGKDEEIEMFDFEPTDE